MLLHETRNDDGIRSFFTDVWECYIKTLLNPFYAVDKPIKSTIFESRVRAIAKVQSLLVTNAAIPITTEFPCYFPLCRLFHWQNRWTSSCARSLSMVFNSNANVLLSYIRWMALWHDRQIDAPRVDISVRVKMCRLRRVRWVDRGIKWWNVNGIILSQSYILDQEWR